MMQRFVWQEGDFVVVRLGARSRRSTRSRVSGSVELAKIRRDVTDVELTLTFQDVTEMVLPVPLKRSWSGQ